MMDFLSRRVNELAGEILFVGSAVMMIAITKRKSATGRRRLCSSPATSPRSLNVPPVAARRRDTMYFGKHPGKPDEFRGHRAMDPPIMRFDDYNWMRDETRKDEKVLSLIRQENEFCEREMAPLDSLKRSIYDSMVGYMKETDEEVPYRRDDFYYYTKTVQGLAYKLHCRYHKSLGLIDSAAPVDAAMGDRSHSVILDENEIAKGTEFCDITKVYPSPSQNKLIYGVDNNGSETYQVYIKDLVLNENLKDVLVDISDNFVWGRDDSSVFYAKLDDQHRPFEVWLHLLGTAQESDILLYREEDQLFNVDVRKSASGQYLIIGSYSIETSEERLVFLGDANGAEGHVSACRQENMYLVQNRVVGLRYSIEHREDRFYFVTNHNGAHNSKLVELPITVSYTGGKDGEIRDICAMNKWMDVRPYEDRTEITEILPFKHGLVVLGRENGLQQVWVSTPAGNSTCANWTRLSFDDEIYAVDETNNHCYDSDAVRLRYSSFVTPTQIMDVSLTSLEKMVLKEQVVPGYDRNKYQYKRVFVPSSKDGTLIPLSLLYLKDQLDAANTPAPALLYGYGSYGVCKEPSFDYTIFPLVDYGIVFAIGHIRGGGELGRSSWYEKGGKYFTKMNTFTDFADCAKHLINSGITQPSQLAMSGRSAGGLLVGAVLNMYPSLFKAAIADVPFVDVLNTMTDPTIPLTVQEWEEWGNSNEKEYYDYMSRYCPYTNVKAQDYPAILVTTGLNDPRVQYWEPLKWVSKLRALKTNKNTVLMLKTDLGSGHFSSSDRYRGMREKSFEMAFIVDQLGRNPNRLTEKEEEV